VQGKCVLCNIVVEKHVGLPSWTCEECDARQFMLESGVTQSVGWDTETDVPHIGYEPAGGENNRLFCELIHGRYKRISAGA
jgi:hypothetical protein